MTFEIEKHQSTVCTWNKQLQVHRSDNQSEYLLMVKSPPREDRQILTSFFIWPGLYTAVPTYPPHPLHTSAPSTRNSSTCGGWCAHIAAVWLLWHKDCPEDSKQWEFIWEKSNKLPLLVNVTAYLLEKVSMIYVSPLPLLTSLGPCWFASLRMLLSENICFLCSLTSNHSAHSSEGHVSHL